MSKTLIIFDIDGTLLYSNKIDTICFAEVYKETYQIDFPTLDWNYFPHVTDDTMFKTAYREQFGKEVKEEEMEDFKDAFVARLREKRQINPNDFREVPGAKDIIERLLNDEKYVVGIGTGGWLKPATLKLQHIGVEPEKLIMGTADGNFSREDIIRPVIQKAKEQNDISDIVYIGDAVWDVRTTRNMKLKLIGIRRKGDHDYLLQLGATQVLSNFLDYQKFLSTTKIATPPKHV